MPRHHQPIVRATLVHEIEIDGLLYEIHMAADRNVVFGDGITLLAVSPEAAREIAKVLLIVADSAPPKKRIRKPATKKQPPNDASIFEEGPPSEMG